MSSGKTEKIYGINGPVIYLKGKTDFKMSEMVHVGEEKLVGEVISLDKDRTTVQVYEETSGLHPGELVEGTGAAVSVTLAPGILNNIFDGIERPLERIADKGGAFITRGVSVDALDRQKLWETHITVTEGDMVQGGTIIAEVPETRAIVHKCMVPPGVEGTVISVVPDGEYTIDETLVTIELLSGEKRELSMTQHWPIRVPRPVSRRFPASVPLVTGQRILDTMFPIAKGGMEGGIVEWDKEKLAWIRQKYESRKKNKRQLLLHFSDATQWGEWLMENRRQYTVETISGRIRPQDVKNHYIEYEPCIMMQLTAEMLKDHLLLPEPMKSEMVALFEVRLEQERQMGNIKFFTKKGMEQFAKTGRIAQFSDLIYRPATVPERIQLLKRFRDWVKQPLQNTCMLDERQINISSRTFVFSTVSLVHNELTLRIGRKGSEYVSICEQGISEKLSKFCYMLESGEMVCTQEECVKAVEEVIAGLEASITSDQSVCGRTGK